MYRLNHLNPPPNHPFQRLYDPYGHAKISSYPSLPDLRRDNNRSDDISMLNSPSSLTIANGLSSNALQAHLYTAFLERKTADVALHVRGTWHAIYRLHRVVLIQAEFFHSLFASGFAESKIKPAGHRLEPDMLDIVLEDPNITRPAFEICIARLYGGGPSLFISPALIATPKYPLTPAFPTSTTRLDPPVISPCPPDQHPASPRFLLSLLATALFLSMPSVASQALASILKTVGPTTAVRYLNFAIGKGIGEPDGEEPEAAVGLENVAELLKDDEEESLAESLATPVETPRAMSSAELMEKLKGMNMDFDRMAERNQNDDSHMEVKKEDPSDMASESSHFADQMSYRQEPTLYYGGVSDKIGEASACWLARWGADMLRLEQQDSNPAPKIANRGQIDPVPKRNTSMARKRATTIPSDGLMGRGMPAFDPQTIRIAPEEHNTFTPVIWRRGGLDARWVRGILSSDALFVQGERERFDMARAVVDMRRAEGTLPEEEAEFDVLFSRGIYYTNMFMQDLRMIAEATCPITGAPYVPKSVLHAARWDQSVLEDRITIRPSGSAPNSPSTSSPTGSSRSKDSKELALTATTAELASSIPRAGGNDTMRFPIPPDSSTRVGDSSIIEDASITMDKLFDVSVPSKKISDTADILSSPPRESNFFGLQPLQLPEADVARDDPSGKARWSPYPPYRFGVEFWNVDALKEKSRLHSRTVWYAGSWWNVYVQVVRKKGVQLGVYLHRQSTVDPIPPSSAPLTLPSTSPAPPMPTGSVGPSSGVPLHQTVSVPTVQWPSSRSSTPRSSSSSPAMSSSLPTSYSAVNVATSNISTSIPATAPPVSPPQPYRDPRGSVTAYFTIACASATGASLTRFTSAPDAFAVSQSWGWKSSSLRTEEYLEVGEDGMPQSNLTAGKEVSFRATVVLGVV